MVLARVGGHYINLDAIAEAHLDDRPNDIQHKTHASITMIGGSVTTLYGQEAVAFISFLERSAQFNINNGNDPRH